MLYEEESCLADGVVALPKLFVKLLYNIHAEKCINLKCMAQ